jgi:hypothetical protein
MILQVEFAGLADILSLGIRELRTIPSFYKFLLPE